jgi:hypothetical protein
VISVSVAYVNGFQNVMGREPSERAHVKDTRGKLERSYNYNDSLLELTHTAMCF